MARPAPRAVARVVRRHLPVIAVDTVGGIVEGVRRAEIAMIGRRVRR